MALKRILITGAGGGLGKILRQSLVGTAEAIRLSARRDIGEPAHGVDKCVGQVDAQHRAQLAPVERHQDQGLLRYEAKDGRQRSDKGSGTIQRELRLSGCHGSHVDDHPRHRGRAYACPPTRLGMNRQL